jgi:hypothetical protein
MRRGLIGRISRWARRIGIECVWIWRVLNPSNSMGLGIRLFIEHAMLLGIVGKAG